MFQVIAEILSSALGIWEHENALKYQKKLLKLEKDYDKEIDKPRIDHNVLDRLERDMIRLSNLVSSEIKNTK